MTYKWRIPYSEHYDYEKFDKKQADIFFERYVDDIDDRLNVLKEYITSQEKDIIFDFSQHSLISIWKWFEKQIVLETKTDEEMKQEIENTPEWLREYISDKKISMETLKIGMDISIYFAETIRRNYSEKIYWGYFTKPKNRMSVNEPVLLGFVADMDLNPRLIITNCIRRSSRESDIKRLYKIYDVWTSKIVDD